MSPLIERLAREADFTVVPQLPERPDWVRIYAGDSRIDNRLERFAALVAQECAALCDEQMNGCDQPSDCAAAIRAAFPMPKG